MEKGVKLVKGAFRLALLCMAAQVFWYTGGIVGSYEGRKTFFTYMVEGTEQVVRNMVESFLPVLSLKEDGILLPQERWMEQIQQLIASELFPYYDYQKQVEQPSDVMLAQDEEPIPAAFLEDEAEMVDSTHVKAEVVSDKKKEKKQIETDKKDTKTKGAVYTMKQLSSYSFMRENFYTVESTAKVLESELNAKNFMSKDFSIQLDGKEPKILIYHTHAASETFKDSRSGKSADTIVGVGDVLTEILEEEYGIPVYHDKSKYDLINGKIDRNKAYSASLVGVNKILAAYPSIDVVIDLHRDGVNSGIHLVTEINGKDTAQIMFFNGVSRTAKNGDIAYLSNPNKINNLAFSFQLQLNAAKNYPGFTRKIFIKGYRYNLHVKPRSLLIEAGANTNTVQEVKNAMDPLADILNDVLRGK